MRLAGIGFCLAFLCILLLAILVLLAKAQEHETVPHDEPTLKIDASIVLVPVTVTDRNGNAEHRLDRENFEIFDNGVKQDISFFSKENIAKSFIILFDNSSSMLGIKYEQALAAFKQLAAQYKAGDEFALMTFTDEFKTIRKFSDDISKPFDYPDTPYGKTSLYDAIKHAADYMRQKARPDNKKSIIIVTDGEDTTSEIKLSTLKDYIAESDIQISVALVTSKENRERFTYKGIVLNMRQISEITGGVFEEIREINDIPKTVAHINQLISCQYILGFNPSTKLKDKEKKPHRLTVKLKKPKEPPDLRDKDLVVNARKSYLPKTN